MTGPFDDVDVLLPSRIHQARARTVAALIAEMSALIEALPTASSPRPFDVGMLLARPTEPEGDADHGNR